MHIILIFLVLSILPIFYKLNFWLYTFQLKEYRLDRFKEYLTTKQGKKAIISFLSLIEIPSLFISIFAIIDFNIISIIIFYVLLLENIFILWKIFRKQIIYPKFTFRIILLYTNTIFLIILTIIVIIKLLLEAFLFSYIFILLVFTPIFIIISNLLTVWLVNYQKTKIINNAIKKSKEINHPIKIAITWSYWKTSIKEFLASILEQKFNILKTSKNINTEIWVSDLIIKKLDNKYDYFIAEIWAYKIWEIDILGKIVNHKYAFLSAIWNQHLWLFGSLENIKKAKFEIINKVIENDWILYLNYDNDNIRNYDLNSKKINIVKYSLNEIDWAYSTDIKEEIWNITKFNFNYHWKIYEFQTYLIWKHNILNITWVLAFCFDIWIDYKSLKKYLLNIKTPNNTQEIIKHKTNTLIDDTYNLSEDWLISWLNLLKGFKWKKILVLDDILELWKEAENIHYNLWNKIAKEYKIDAIILVGINYEENIKKWLLSWWYDENKIIKKLIDVSNSTILFEWKKSKIYINKLLKNV